MPHYVEFSLFGTETFSYSPLVNAEISPDEVIAHPKAKSKPGRVGIIIALNKIK